MKFFLVVLYCTAAFAPAAVLADSCDGYSASYYCENGKVYSLYNNTLYDNQGVSWSTYGSTAYGADGSAYSKYGDTTYDSQGRSWTLYGNTIYQPDGSSCSWYANTLYCPQPPGSTPSPQPAGSQAAILLQTDQITKPGK